MGSIGPQRSLSTYKMRPIKAVPAIAQQTLSRAQVKRDPAGLMHVKHSSCCRAMVDL